MMYGAAAPVCSLGQALKMRATLARLCAQHSVTFQCTALAPLLPLEGDFWAQGVAAETSTDRARQKFRPWSLSWPRAVRDIPLLIRHQSDQVAGVIEDLRYSRSGGVEISARVTNSAASALPAFSVAATVKKYEMRDEDSDQFFGHILEIIEVSLTDAPANV